ncbi:MAG: hypothetical protein ACX94C_09395 [Phycisphaerales bacterium]
MPHHPASTQQPPDPMPQTGLREGERRYLRRSLLFLCIIFGLLNLIGCRLLIANAANPDKCVLRRVGWSTYTDDYWPSIPPKPWNWPRPERRADFRGGGAFINACYATAWEDGTHYSMDVYASGFPLNTYERRTLRIIEKDGTVLLAQPPIGQSPRIRLSFIGLTINTLCAAGLVWLLIALLPCTLIVLDRASRARQWASQWLCPGCGYDVQDLPVCPECGRENKTRYRLARDLT